MRSLCVSTLVTALFVCGSCLAMAEASSPPDNSGIPVLPFGPARVEIAGANPTSAKSRCVSALVDSQAHLPGILNIGVLARMFKGRIKLVRGFYLTGAHDMLLLYAYPPEIEKVLWMGEIRFDVDAKNRPRIYEANETSKHYFETLMPKPWVIEGRVIPVENNVNNLPLEMRAANFKGRRFGDGDIHLAPEFKGKKDSVRHQVRGAFEILNRNLGNIRKAVQENQPDGVLLGYVESMANEREIVRETILYSLSKELIDFERVKHTLALLDALEQRPISRSMIKALSMAEILTESSAILRDRIVIFDIDP